VDVQDLAQAGSKDLTRLLGELKQHGEFFAPAGGGEERLAVLSHLGQTNADDQTQEVVGHAQRLEGEGIEATAFHEGDEGAIGVGWSGRG
jgi:hypothetical protein